MPDLIRLRKASPRQVRHPVSSWIPAFVPPWRDFRVFSRRSNNIEYYTLNLQFINIFQRTPSVAQSRMSSYQAGILPQRPDNNDKQDILYAATLFQLQNAPFDFSLFQGLRPTPSGRDPEGPISASGSNF
jgi:hypothetical protein